MNSYTISQWEAGDLPDESAARALALDLAEIEDQRRPLDKEEEQIRNVLSRIVGRLGNKLAIAGFGELVVTAPSVVTSYDSAKITALVVRLAAEGQSELAEALARCEKRSSRAGGLRITREKRP